jgi:hypothetical protein
MTEMDREIKRNTLHTFLNREEKEIMRKMSAYRGKTHNNKVPREKERIKKERKRE